MENQFARTIGASAVALAGKHGGRLPQTPANYRPVEKTFIAIRALKNNDQCYDDIGTVANGPFTFEGYERVLV